MDKKKIVFGIGIVLTALAALTAPALADYNVFHLVPVDSSCDGAGCTTTVWVMVNTSYNDINGFQATIIFDPNVVNLTFAEKGTSPAWYMWEWRYVPPKDSSKKCVMLKGADVMGAFGPGELQCGIITLEGIKPGTSSLHFANASELAQGADHKTMIVNPSGDITPITMEDGTFTCVGPEETFPKPLVTGWNLISLPLTATDMKVSNVIDTSLSGSYDALYRYDATTRSWVSLSSPDTMSNGAGYFIHMTAADTWTYSGNAYTAMTGGLSDGLNMIGWLNCSKSITDALSSIDGNYYYAARWNATTQKFETYNPIAPAGFNDFTTMDRGEGYFISMKEAATLTESC